jgi:Redoxin
MRSPLPSFILALALIACRSGSALDLDGGPVDPLAGTAAATVLAFVSTTCPLSNRYAPELRRLQDRFEPRGVAFYVVYPDERESPEAIAEHLREYATHARPVRDPERALVRRVGATRTPEVAVFRRGGALAYHGRVDDRFGELGLERPAPTRNDLAEALDAVLEGIPVEVPFTTPLGCAIRERR